MEFFVIDEELVRLKASLSGLKEMPRLSVLSTLAWHLRQRDPEHALDCVAQARAQLAQLPQMQGGPDAQHFQARWYLVEAVVCWLRAQSDPAREKLGQALPLFEALFDATGCCDCHWLLSRIALDHGEQETEVRHLQLALDYARRIDDRTRKTCAEVGMALSQALRSVASSLTQWKTHFEMLQGRAHPGLRALILGYFGACASLSSDFGQAIPYLIEAHDLARQTGQIREAIRNAVNIGDAFSNLNDHQSALEWMQRGLEQARAMGWPVSVGISLLQTADVLRHLGRLDAAQELLDEALGHLAPLGVTRNYAVALAYLGDLAQDRRDYPAALGYFQQLQQHAATLQQTDFEISAWRGLADALSHLTRVDEAVAAAHKALALASDRANRPEQIRVLQILASIHERHALPLAEADAEAEANSQRPALFYLQQAMQIASGITGYIIDGELFDALADAHAANGEYAKAFDATRRANLARESTHTHAATNRAIAMQVRHQTERVRAQSEYHLQLAMAEARRAEVLADTNEILARLGTVGQEITAQLQTDAVFVALNRHVHGLLEVSSFAVYLVEPEGSHLMLAFGVESGQPLPPARIAKDNPYSSAARCWREAMEISINQEPVENDPFLVPGTLPSLSRLFAPLMSGEQILGVMTVQALHYNAYGVAERFIFRTLCAYGAIALENAHAYQQLQMAQAQLVEQEKLAALGSLVAGVAHELNTPIGNSLMMSSALQEKADNVSELMAGRNLQHANLVEFLDDAQQAASVIIRGLTAAADLVSSFKQVAVDRTAARRRIFNLQQTCHEVVATMMNQIRLAGHQFELDVPGNIMLDSYPGPFGQAIGNLISNALAHAFPERSGGLMRLEAQSLNPDWVRISFSDDGCGIAEANLKRIFDPFFTSSQGNNGLGLSITYNIATSLLNGQIRAASQPGHGTRFELDMPLVVDHHE
jgi:signal transduction histidine kinase